MKLTLDGAAVSTLTLRCGAPTKNLEDDVLGVLRQLAMSGHDPLTRKDVTAVLSGMGRVISTSKEWKTVGRAITKVCSPTGKRGFYTQPPQDPRTLTAKWFEEQIRRWSLDRRVAACLRRNFPRETFEDLLSEAHEWFVRWGHRGTCDKYIAKGRPPSLSILVIWVSGKITHRLYHDAQDALNREFRGARTQVEVRRRSQNGTGADVILAEALKVDPNAPKVTWVGDAEAGTLAREFVAPEVVSEYFGSGVSTDVVNGNISAKYDEAQICLIRDIIRVRRTRAADRYARFLDHLLEGRDKEETAALEGVSELRVTHIYQRVRNDLREAPKMLEVALKVLKAITEEPFSTVDEISEDTSLDGKPLKQALRLLVLRGLATEGRGRCFAPTDAGHNAVGVNSLVG